MFDFTCWIRHVRRREARLFWRFNYLIALCEVWLLRLLDVLVSPPPPPPLIPLCLSSIPRRGQASSAPFLSIFRYHKPYRVSLSAPVSRRLTSSRSSSQPQIILSLFLLLLSFDSTSSTPLRSFFEIRQNCVRLFSVEQAHRRHTHTHTAMQIVWASCNNRILLFALKATQTMTI